MAYTGGKGGPGVAQQIINQLPRHAIYIEPFAGRAAVARAKRLASQTLLYDINSDVVQELRAELGSQPGVAVSQDNALALLARLAHHWQRREVLVYCDPPYLYETRAGGRRPRYPYEFGEEEQHRQLLRLLKLLPCNVAVSGYPSALYAHELRSWRYVDFVGPTRGGARMERLWMNYAEPLELHDYRHLGNDFREREQIKRQQQRWKERLRQMPARRRYAILAALDEVRQDAGASPGIAMLEHLVASPAPAIGAPEAAQEALWES